MLVWQLPAGRRSQAHAEFCIGLHLEAAWKEVVMLACQTMACLDVMPPLLHPSCHTPS